MANEQNDDLFLNVVDWLSNNQKLTDIRVKESNMRPIGALTSQEKTSIRILVIGAVPLMMIGLGIVVYVVRNKKKSKLL